MPKEDIKVFLKANRDDDLYSSTVPDRLDFWKMLVPAKCTGLVQPAEVYFFRSFKNMVKFIMDTVVMTPDINFSTETTTICSLPVFSTSISQPHPD
ncbi:hypothetical protein ANN_18799 [Periplaneta americana]|uniref:Uncharacterized protein n=1 Tax=Periplaneta americana TaxID=6978 RepID=A0ABQ8SPS0_PERAM|nr:hypothetical protein ANN_18799 [Periplaneta americana]